MDSAFPSDDLWFCSDIISSCLTDEFVIYIYITNWWHKGLPLVACPFGTLAVLYRGLHLFCSLKCLLFGIQCLHLSTSLSSLWDFCTQTICLNNGLDNIQWASFTSDVQTKLRIIIRNQECFRLCNWFYLRRLRPWMNQLPPVWWFTLSSMFLKLPLECKCCIMERNFLPISCFC